MGEYFRTTSLVDYTICKALNSFAFEKFIPRFVTPNMITFVSGLCALYVIAHLRVFMESEASFWGVIFMAYAYVFFDCLDGNYARRTNQTSKLGMYLDNALDWCFFIGSETVLVLLAFELAHPSSLWCTIIISSLNGALSAMMMDDWKPIADSMLSSRILHMIPLHYPVEPFYISKVLSEHQIVFALFYSLIILLKLNVVVQTARHKS
jgi:phosphatidylglycerophosphate synthase